MASNSNTSGNSSFLRSLSVDPAYVGGVRRSGILMTHSSTSSLSNLTPSESDNSLRSNLPRRTLEGTRIIRDNINNVIREFQPLVDTARTVNARGISLSSLLNSPGYSSQSPPQNQEQSSSDSFVINLENPVAHRHNYAPLANGDNIDGAAANSHYLAANLLNNPNQNPNENPTNSNNNNADDPSAETLRNVIEAQQSLHILQRYIPFILILLVKGVYDHREGIFNLIILFVTFLHANSVVKKEATKQARRSLSKLLIALLYTTVCLVFIDFIFGEENLYLNLLFMPVYKKSLTVWDLLWMLCITDFILKLITIIFKLLLTMLPARIIQFQKRGKIYLFMESISQLYRSLATIQSWLYYLLESYQGGEKIIGVFLSAAYMVSKGSDLMTRIKLCKTATLKLLQNVTLGSSPSKDQIQTAGNQCPICHDEYDSPVLLQCRHIFCESCVSTWFDREQTCPLCRAKIVDDPSWRDGSTTMFMQLF